MAAVILLICIAVFAYCHYTDDPEENYRYLMSIYEDYENEHGGKKI